VFIRVLVGVNIDTDTIMRIEELRHCVAGACRNQDGQKYAHMGAFDGHGMPPGD
jgi:hypothetical protein